MRIHRSHRGSASGGATRITSSGILELTALHAHLSIHQPHHSMALRQTGVPEVEQRQSTQGIKLFTACAQFQSSQKDILK